MKYSTYNLENTTKISVGLACIKEPINMRLVLLLVVIFAFAQQSFGATYYSRGTGNWNGAVWATTTNGTATSATITSADNVVIQTGNVITINTAGAVCNSLTLKALAASNGITITSPGTLTVSTAITINAPSANNRTSTLAVGDGALSAASITMAATTANSRDCIVSVSTGTINVSGNITMNSSASRNQIVFSDAGTLNIGGSISGGTISGAAGGYTAVIAGTVNFNGSVAQTIPNTPYNFYNVIVSNTSASGAVFANNVTVNNIINTITVANGGYLNNSANRTIARGANNEIVVDSGGVFNLGTTSIYWGSAGNTATINGTLQTANIAGFSGTTTTAINSTNNPTITLGANSTIDYNAPSGGQAITSTTYSNLTLSNTSGTQTAGGALTVNGTLTTTAGGTLNMGTNQLLGTLGTIANAGTIQTQNTSATPFPSGKTWGGTIEFNSPSAQTTPASTFNNLIINNSFGVSLDAAVTVNNQLTLTSGLLTLGAYNLTFGENALAVAGTPFSSTKMILQSGIGEVRKLLTTLPQTFAFPIGENIGTTDYSPIDVTVTSATLAPGALMSVKVTDAKHPNNNSPSNFISRYWTVNQTGITNINASLSATFAPSGDVDGSYTNIITSRYVAPTWSEHNVTTATTISAANLVAFGDFTGRNNLPFLNVTPSSLLNFTYIEGFGPSVQQSFAVSGSALSTNITILPTDTFEISTLSGASFTPISLITVNVINREVIATPIYVRLKAGFTPRNIVSESITCSSVGVSNVYVVCSGSVTNAPLIQPSVDTLSNFVYRLGAGPSASQPFTVDGSYLTNDIIVTAPANYQVQYGASAWGASVTLPRTGQNLSLVVNVRLKAGLLVSFYNEDITLTTTNGITKTVRCNGEVNTATVAVSKFSLAGFIYTVNNGPSSIQSFVASGTNLTANLVVTPPTNFEISTDSVSFTLSAISIAPVSGSVSTKIFVRMKAGLALGVVASQKINVTSTGAIPQTVACSGQIVNQPTTISSIGTLNGFFYIFGSGPSVKQIINVSAVGLSSAVTVTAPSHYEISLTGAENSFVTNGGTLSIANVAGKVNAVPVYIRLKSGWAVGDYNLENVQLSATGAVTVNVVCNGKVVVAPTIVAGPAGLDPTCPNQNITLTSSGTGIDNLIWTGPNSFYSTLQNPPLGVVTAANNGTYTVTGNSLSGVNLITNGDFELGNTGFGSSYIYQQNAPPQKGNYWVSANPKDVFNGFCGCADHSISGTQMMIVDGGTTSGMVVWSQTVSVAPQTDFQFSYWLLNVYNYNNDINKAKLQLYINNVPIGTVNTAPPYGQPWANFKYNANSGSNTSLQLTLINTSTEPNGNDFALDDIDFQQVVQVSSSVTLNVVPTVVPSLIVTASDNPVFSNTIVTYTATPTNGGSIPTYQWQVNGVNQGAATTNPILEYTPIEGDSIGCVMTSNYECVSPQTATNFVKMTVNPRTNYWRGNISTHWGTPANWTGGFVPVAGDDVVFAKKSNNNGVAAERDLQLDINRTIGFLINDSASLKVIIPPALTLIVNNSIQSGINPDKIRINASTSLANGSIIYRNPQNTPAYGTVEMYSPASWDLSRPINNKYNWQYMGIPVASLPVLPTFYGTYVRELIESDPDTATHWRAVSNSYVMIPFKGYELCQQNANTFYTFKGQLLNSDFNSGQLAKTTGALYPGQHLFANPYATAIDIRQIEFGADMEATAYLYNTGTFISWRNNPNKSVLLEVPVPGQYNSSPKLQAGSFTGIPRQIPSMGTFLVRILATKQSSPACFVKVNYNFVAMGNTDKLKVKAASLTDEQTTTGIVVEGENGLDKMWIMTHESYSRNFDNGYDGKKMIGKALNPQIYAVESDGNYQINSVNDIDNTNIAFQAGQDTEYTLKFTHNEKTLEKYTQIYLHDLLENKVVDISANESAYTFTAQSTSKPVVRFRILANNPNNSSSTNSYTKIYNFDNKLYVQNFSNQAGKVTVYDISGRTIGIRNISANENIQMPITKHNVYIVKVVVGSVTETKKMVLQ